MIDRLTDNRGFDNFDYRFVALIVAILGVGVLLVLASGWR